MQDFPGAVAVPVSSTLRGITSYLSTYRREHNGRLRACAVSVCFCATAPLSFAPCCRVWLACLLSSGVPLL